MIKISPCSLASLQLRSRSGFYEVLATSFHYVNWVTLVVHSCRQRKNPSVCQFHFLSSQPQAYTSSPHPLTHCMRSLLHFLHLIRNPRWVKYNTHIMHETHEDCALIKSTQKDPITNAKSDYIRFHACLLAWRCFKRSNWQYWVSASILPLVCPWKMSLTFTWTTIQKKFIRRIKPKQISYLERT